MYLVPEVQTEIMASFNDNDIDVSLADKSIGLVGMLPVFEDYESAVKYSCYPDHIREIKYASQDT